MRRTVDLSVRRAFTLVELLVVIGIIAVLVAILLPVVSKARRQAESTVCLSQLRQIGTAWMTYLHDSKGRFPLWTQNLHWFYGGKHPVPAEEYLTIGDKTLAKQDRILNPYIGAQFTNEKRAAVFRCPADWHIAHRTNGSDVGKGMPIYDYFGNSYMMNRQLLGYDRPETKTTIEKLPVNLKFVQIPHHLVILTGDPAWWYYAMDDQHNADWHRQYPYINIVFLDGHAARTPMVPSHKIARTQDYSIGIRYEQDPTEEDEPATP